MLTRVNARTPGHRESARALANTLRRAGQKGGRGEEVEFICKLFHNDLAQKGAGPTEEKVSAEFVPYLLYDRLWGREGRGREDAKFVRKLFHNKIGQKSVRPKEDKVNIELIGELEYNSLTHRGTGVPGGWIGKNR